MHPCTRALLFAASLPLSACASAPSSSASSRPEGAPGPAAAARRAPPAAPAQAQARNEGYAGRYRLAYAATVTSSCSESWDISTWSGDVTLALADGGAARLDLGVAMESRGGAQPPASPDPSSYGRSQIRCPFDGTWSADEFGELRVELPRRAGDSPASECRPARGALDTDPEATWVLRCTYKLIELPDGDPRGRPHRDGALACRTAGGTPWIWNLVLEDGDALHLGDARPVFAEAEHGDTIEGDLLLPDGAVIEAPPGPTEWFLGERAAPSIGSGRAGQ